MQPHRLPRNLFAGLATITHSPRGLLCVRKSQAIRNGHDERRASARRSLFGALFRVRSDRARCSASTIQLARDRPAMRSGKTRIVRERERERVSSRRTRRVAIECRFARRTAITRTDSLSVVLLSEFWPMAIVMLRRRDPRGSKTSFQSFQSARRSSKIATSARGASGGGGIVLTARCVFIVGDDELQEGPARGHGCGNEGPSRGRAEARILRRDLRCTRVMICGRPDRDPVLAETSWWRIERERERAPTLSENRPRGVRGGDASKEERRIPGRDQRAPITPRV